MKVRYKTNKLEEICSNYKKAKTYFGGSEKLAKSLLARINIIKNADVLNDIIMLPQFRFHKLENLGKGKNLLGYFAIDVCTIRDKWRIILEPLDDNENSFESIDISLVARRVRIVEIMEVSDHYE